MDFDFNERWPYFLGAAAKEGVPEIWREDCAGDCALRLWRTREGVPWKQVVHRAVQDFKRTLRQGRRRDKGKSVDPPLILSLDEMEDNHPWTRARLLLDEHAITKVTPERVLCCKESLEAVESLPERQRRMLLMRALGWRFCEIAVMEGISDSRSCQIVKEARQILRAACAVVA